MRSSPRTSTQPPRGKRLPLSFVTVAVFAAVSVSSDQPTPRAQSAPQTLIELQGAGTPSGDAPMPIVSGGGFQGLRMGDEQMTYTVAVRNADGTVRIQHAAGGKEAKRQVIAGGNRGMTAEKERLRER